MEIFVWFIILVAAGVGLYFLYDKVLKERMFPTKKPSPKKKPSPTGDIITLTNDGTRIQKGTTVETYLERPFIEKCRKRPEDPSYCSTITSTTEMNYVYDPIGGGFSGQDFTTTFNHATNTCSDGTQDCLYTEKYDADRTLISITNSKGEDFIQRVTDDIWSGKVDFNADMTIDGTKTTFKDMILKMMEYDRNTGIMYLLRPNGDKMKIVPGMKTIGGGPIDGVLTVSTGMFIMYIIFYYYGNDLPKPTITLELTSDLPFGQLYEQTYTV